MTTSAGHLLGRRRTPKASPMAVPLDPDAHRPLGVRFGEWGHGIVTRRLSAAGRRVLSWTLLALCVGALGVAYLLQTSYVASLASARATLERETTDVQDANARLTARVAEAQAIGKAEPAARAQGLRIVPAGAISYLSVQDVPDPTAIPTVLPAAPPNLGERLQAVLRGRASADAPPPARAGSAATAEATMRSATASGTPPMAPAGGRP